MFSLLSCTHLDRALVLLANSCEMEVLDQRSLHQKALDSICRICTNRLKSGKDKTKEQAQGPAKELPYPPFTEIISKTRLHVRSTRAGTCHGAHYVIPGAIPGACANRTQNHGTSLALWAICRQRLCPVSGACVSRGFASNHVYAGTRVQ